jgi:hypothetical protein
MCGRKKASHLIDVKEPRRALVVSARTLTTRKLSHRIDLNAAAPRRLGEHRRERPQHRRDRRSPIPLPLHMEDELHDILDANLVDPPRPKVRNQMVSDAPAVRIERTLAE